MKFFTPAFATALALYAFPAMAEETLSLSVMGVKEGKPISAPYAYCAPTAEGKSQKGKNLRPAVAWKDAPKETQSFALVMVDSEVPTDFTDAGKDGKMIPAEMPRQNFYHWAVVDLPASTHALPAGKGRGSHKTPLKIGREGVNDFPSFLKKDPALFVGYDGPCPPWNDARMHRYHFQLYALDVPQLDLPEGFAAKEAASALKPHILAMAEVTGTYTLNPAIEK